MGREDIRVDRPIPPKGHFSLARNARSQRPKLHIKKDTFAIVDLTPLYLVYNAFKMGMFQVSIIVSISGTLTTMTMISGILKCNSLY